MTTAAATKRRWHFSLSHSAIGIWRWFVPRFSLPHSLHSRRPRPRSLARSLCAFFTPGRAGLKLGERTTASGDRTGGRDGEGGGRREGRRGRREGLQPQPSRPLRRSNAISTNIITALQRDGDHLWFLGDVPRQQREKAIGATWAYIIQSVTRTDGLGGG